MTDELRDLSVVIVAAGHGERFGGRNKLLEAIAGKKVLARAVEAFAATTAVCEIVVVLNRDDADRCVECLDALAVDANVRTCLGGSTRRESVRAGLAHLQSRATLVAIHDAARPLVSADLISCVLGAARRTGSAVPVVPITDTVFEVAGDSIRGVVPRDGLRAAQTPQIARYAWLREALDEEPEGTDEASALMKCGFPIELVEGSSKNLKITWPQDIALAAALLENSW